MALQNDLVHLVVTMLFSFLLGLEMKTYRLKFGMDKKFYFIGTTRTFTVVGILGFIFFKIGAGSLILYVSGLLSLTLLFALFYRKVLDNGGTSVLLFVILLVVYTFGPLTQIYPLWMSAFVFVLIIFVLNAQKYISSFSTNVDPYEFETLGKIILLSAVILPLLPNKNIIPYIPLSPFKIWLTVVVVSSISYGAYILHKYIFPSKGLFLTGIVGGMYSSTATTVVLAKKAKEIGPSKMMTASIIMATVMMYLRLIVVAFIFNAQIAKAVSLPFLLFALIGFGITFLYYKSSHEKLEDLKFVDKNPLELSTALIFSALFVAMILLTHYVTNNFGANGLKLLSFAAGFTDIDPFILSLLTGKYIVSSNEIYTAIVVSAGSNNILKAIYTIWFGKRKNTIHSFAWLMILGVGTILFGLFIKI